MGIDWSHVAALTAAIGMSTGGAWAQALPLPLGAARAQGEALLAVGRARGLFDNITADSADGVKLRHRASGLICEFNYGAGSNSVVVYDTQRRGDHVACVTGGPAGDRVLYVTRAPGRSLDDAFAHDLDEVKRAHPGAQAFSLPSATLNGPILSLLNRPVLPPSRTARFIVEHTFTTVSSAMVGEWSLEFRYTCPEERRDLAAAILQPTLWVMTLAQIAKAPITRVDPRKQAI